MSKLIIIRGISNSGKSTSIRAFAATYGVHLPAARKDFVLVMPVTKAAVTYKVGIVTGGDIASMINDGLNFTLAMHACDYIVCATKMSGNSVTAMNLWLPRATGHVYENTNCVSGLAAIAAETARMVSAIDAHIP